MERRRIELAPVVLFALSATTLGLSCALLIALPTPSRQAPIEEPLRTAGPLVWAVEQLPPLVVVDPAPALPEPVLTSCFDDPASYELLAPYQLRPLERENLPMAGKMIVPVVNAAVLSRWSLGPTSSVAAAQATGEALATATEPGNRDAVGSWLDDQASHFLVREKRSFVVLLPGEPAWRAGNTSTPVVSVAARRRWSVGPLDLLAQARSTGSVLAIATTSTERSRLLALAGKWLQDSLLVEPPAVVATAPRLISANMPLKSESEAPITPIATTPAATPAPRSVRSTAPSIDAPTIVEYLARSPRSGHFPDPRSLATQLDRVAEAPQHAAWAWAVAYRLRTLLSTSTDEVAAHRSLATLREAASEALALADDTANPARATELRRASYAVTRRVATWRAEQSQVLAMQLKRVTPIDRLESARWALAMPSLGTGHGSLLEDRVAPERPTLRIARQIEAYEQRPTSRLATILADDADRLARLESEEARTLATAIQQNYRNANLRVAVASTLLERMLPRPEPIVSPIHDRIAGAPVRGRSTTETELAIRFAPDDEVWRIGLEATGMVMSRTQSRGGPAVVNAKGTTSFAAKKLVVVTPNGLLTAPAVADAQTRSQRLMGLATDYDRIPLLRNYVRSEVRKEYGRLQSRAKAETRLKVERQVSRALDQRVDQQLGQMQGRYTTDVASRATALGLQIVPIELRTTESRVISRVRIAGNDQLGAHTPRMRAPSDSLLSVQMHESMLNNAIEGLDLAGQTLTTDELRERIATRLDVPQREVAPDEQATLRFTDKDPVRISLKEGRVEMTLGIAEIRVRGRRHRNFRIHAYYRPEVDGLTAVLVQEGTPDIEGRLRTGARIHLHGVIGKVLGDNARIPLVQVNEQTPERFAAALVGLATNQLVIEDGWLGIAVGPQRKTGVTAVRVGTYVR